MAHFPLRMAKIELTFQIDLVYFNTKNGDSMLAMPTEPNFYI